MPAFPRPLRYGLALTLACALVWRLVAWTPGSHTHIYPGACRHTWPSPPIPPSATVLFGVLVVFITTAIWPPARSPRLRWARPLLAVVLTVLVGASVAQRSRVEERLAREFLECTSAMWLEEHGRDPGRAVALSIDAPTIERVARGALEVALVHIEASEDTTIHSEALAAGSSSFRLIEWTLRQAITNQRGSDVRLSEGQRSSFQLPRGDTRLEPGRSYVIAYRVTGSGKALPFFLEVAALDDTKGNDQAYVSAGRSLLQKSAPQRLEESQCKCAPGDPLCSCL